MPNHSKHETAISLTFIDTTNKPNQIIIIKYLKMNKHLLVLSGSYCCMKLFLKSFILIFINVLDLDGLIDQSLRKNANGNFSCALCGKEGTTRQNTRNHIETHLAVSGFNCNYCGKNYRTRNSLNVHKSSLHRSDASVRFGEIRNSLN